ncbi:MAG: transporter permease, partial [Devosia sp.]|nr:transporter permease [Devosia sp.]
TSLVSAIADSGQGLDRASIDRLTALYGLDQPFYVQYWNWISGIIFRGDFGWSFDWGQPVSRLLWDRMGITLLVSGLSLILIWLIAIPIGIYSAVRRYSAGDYIFTFIGFIGLAIPTFILALGLMYVSFTYFGLNVGGLFSPEYEGARWSIAKFWDLLAHLWIPVVVVAISSTAALIRVMRANLADELGKPYVTTARAKGLSEFTLIMRYPVRIALNPFVSTIGWVLPALISGVTITAIVLNLPMAGPLLLRALVSQDMYLAGAFILIMSVLTLIGMLISDILLALLDPRIRYQ